MGLHVNIKRLCNACYDVFFLLRMEPFSDVSGGAGEWGGGILKTETTRQGGLERKRYCKCTSETTRERERERRRRSEKRGKRAMRQGNSRINNATGGREFLACDEWREEKDANAAMMVEKMLLRLTEKKVRGSGRKHREKKRRYIGVHMNETKWERKVKSRSGRWTKKRDEEGFFLTLDKLRYEVVCITIRGCMCIAHDRSF